jgi:hypothetical protein
MSKDDDKPAPAVMPRPVAPKPAPVRSVHDWAKAKGTERWAFVGASRGRKWSVGEWVDPTYCTEAEYDNAINFAKYGK